MRKKITLKPSFKSTALIIGMLTLPMMVSAQNPWKWECEAENSSEIVYGKVTQATADGHVVSGGAYVEELSVGKDSRLGFVISGVPAPGMYDLTVSYISMQERYLLVKVNDRDPIVVDCNETTGSWNGTPTVEKDEEGNDVNRPGIATKTITVYIPYAGDNDLVIKAFDGYSESEKKILTFAPNLDKITIVPSTAELKVAPQEAAPIEIEMETCTNFSGSAGLMTENIGALSGTSGVTLKSSGRAIYKITVPEAGAYALYIDYTTMQTRWIYMKVNSQPKQYLEFAEKTPSWGDKPSDDPERPSIYKKAVLLYLEKGENTVLFNSYNGATSEHSDSPNLDRMELVKVSADITDPGYERVAYANDYTDWATITADQTGDKDLNVLTDNDERTVLKFTAKQVNITAQMPYPLMLTGYAIAGSNDMTDWKVQGSSDGQQWTDIGSIGVAKEGTFEQHNVEFNTSEPTGYTYIRLAASAGDNLEIAEWQLFGSPCISVERPLPVDMFEGKDEMLIASENGWAFSEEYGEKYQHLIDGRLDTKFTTDERKSPSEATPIWVRYDYDQDEYPDGVKAQSYSLTSAWSYPDRNPKNWTLSGFVKEADNWIILDQRVNMNFASPSSTLLFNIKEPKTCSGYKLEITANNGSRDNTQLVAWQLFNNSMETSVNEVKADKSTSMVYASGDKIMIKADKKATYCVYGLTGQKVKEGVVEASAEVTVPSGLYIVTVNGIATKVLTNQK